MADQNAAAEQAEQQKDVGTPDTGPGTEGEAPAAAQHNWEDRYEEVRAWSNRLVQENAELKTQAQLVEQLKSEDAAEQRQALEALGYTVPEEEEDTPVYEPDPRLRQELDELKQWKNSLTETEQRESNYTQYREQFDPQLKELGVPEAFLTNVADIAYNQLDAIQTPNGPQPDLEGAVKWFKEVAEMFADVPEVQSKVRKSWANTKPRSAFTSAGGGEGTQVLDTDSHENRVAIMMQRLQDNQQ